MSLYTHETLSYCHKTTFFLKREHQYYSNLIWILYEKYVCYYNFQDTMVILLFKDIQYAMTT